MQGNVLHTHDTWACSTTGQSPRSPLRVRPNTHQMHCNRNSTNHNVRIVCNTHASNGQPLSESHPVSKRTLLLAGTLALAATTQQAQAVGFQKELKKRKIPLDEYATSEVDGLRYYELIEGQGKIVEKGDRVLVHFDCLYKSLDVVSTRAARLLAGNRVVAEPFSFVAGSSVDLKVMRAQPEIAGALVTGLGGPQAPPALSTAVIGMKKGGKRSVIVPPEVGYGDQGLMEIPPGATIELQIELLEVA